MADTLSNASLQCADTKLTVEKIWERKIKDRVSVMKNTFQNWNAMAGKFVHVAGGGEYSTQRSMSLHVCATDFGGRFHICFDFDSGSEPQDTAGRGGWSCSATHREYATVPRWYVQMFTFLHILMQSSDSPAGQMVKNKVIPAIALIQRRCQLPVNFFLQISQLDAESSLWSELELSDHFFDSLKVK